MQAPKVGLVSRVIALVAVMGVPVPGSADLLFDGAEFQVNTYTTDGQYGSAARTVARAPDGSFVVVWWSYGDRDGNYQSVHGQRYDSAGAAVGSEFQVNSYTTNTQYNPAVSAAADGSFVVVWESYGQDGDGPSVQAQRYDDTGAPVGTEFQVNSYTTGEQYHPAVSSAADGSFVVVWQSFGPDGSGFNVQGQRYDDTGAPVGTEFQINAHTTGLQGYPEVAAAADGSFVVVWDSYDVQDGSYTGVRGQRYDSAGAAVGSEFQVNSYTTGFQGGAPMVATAADGSFVVVWISYGQDGSGLGIFGQRYDATGAAVGSEFQVNSYTTYTQVNPEVSVAPDGSFVVVWASNGQDGSGYSVQGQRYDATGVAVGTEFQVNSYTTGSQGYSNSIAVDAAGDFVVVWSSPQDGSGYGVFGQRLCQDADADLACDIVIADEEVSETVVAGGTVTSDPEADGATPTDPIESWVTSPNPGTVTLKESVISTDPPVFEIDITAPPASPADPLVLEFRVDSTLAASFDIRKNGVPLDSECTGIPDTASPDPCIDSVTALPDADVLVTVLTSSASVWRLEGVVMAFTGFFAPVDNEPMLNKVKAGSAIPIKFRLGGNYGLDIFEPGFPASQSVTCDTRAPVDAIEVTVTAGNSSLSYDPAAGVYTYVWKTAKNWATSCRKLTLTLSNDSVHTASFKFTK